MLSHGGKQSVGICRAPDFRSQETQIPNSATFCLYDVLKLTSPFWNFNFLKCEDHSATHSQSSC